DPLPPSAAVPLTKGDSKYSPPREGERRRRRQGVGHTASAACASAPRASLLIRLRGFQCQFLHAPVRDFAHVQFVLASAIHFVNRAELLQELSGGSELA